MKELLPLLSILFLFTACSQQVYDEYTNDVTEIFADISLSEELNLYVDGAGQPAEGLYTSTYQGGSVQADVTFSGGMISQGEIFREDGLLTIVYSTENDLMKYTIYTENGDPKLISLFGDDLADRREFHVWHADGSRFVESDQSIYKMWYENGQQQLEVPAVDGKTHGKVISWHENGRVKSEYPFTDGEKNGTFTDWDEEGNILRERVYEMGELISDS